MHVSTTWSGKESHASQLFFLPHVGPESPWPVWTCNWKRVGRCLPPCSVGLLVTKQVWSVTAQLSSRELGSSVSSGLESLGCSNHHFWCLGTTGCCAVVATAAVLLPRLSMVWPSCLGGNYTRNQRQLSKSGLFLLMRPSQGIVIFHPADEIDESPHKHCVSLKEAFKHADQTTSLLWWNLSSKQRPTI